MSVGPKLELRQGQSLVMTAQLQQSIKLLQLSSLELLEYVEQELERNPLLMQEEGEDAAEPAEEEMEKPETARNEDEYENETPLDSGDGEQSWDTGADVTYPNRNRSFDEDEEGIEQTLEGELTLRDHLEEQLQVDVTEPVKRFIGQHLIDMVDDEGYIKGDLQELANMMGCEMALIEETLALLQQCDPPGVCARNLAECLSIQLKEKDRLDPAMESLLQHLDLVARGDIASLTRLCGVDAEDIRQMIAEIRQLNPKPGNRFNSEMVQPVIPDVFLRRQGEQWRIELNSDALPRVLVNRQYFSLLNTKARNKQEKKYLSEQLATANWLVKALDQRAQTILTTATELVKQQEGFFRHGIRHLRPLTLKDIAKEVNLHESTISRVTSSKYISTSRGIFELKYFFTSSIESATGGESYSSETIRHIIKEMIDGESPDDILSDDTIAEMLQAKGMDIARRTVAKYREGMHIPSSVQRRREKKRTG